ncbi:MAG: peptidyl-dipeptidase [Actinomycetota bacterium]|nr:peptidyl-dipeptidase [Actinomycetota bacterium]
MTESAHRLVSGLAERFQELETEFHRAYWDTQVEAGSATEQRRAELELELRRIKGDPAALESVLAALREPNHDAVLSRQLEVLRLSLTGNQMGETERAEMVALSTEVEGEFASYRPTVDGHRLNDNEIDDVLRTSNDEDERERVWRASKEVGGLVAERVRELVRLRNRAAHNLGFADFYRMELELQELPEEWLFEILGELEDLTQEPFAGWKEDLDRGLKQRFGVEDLFPWHYADPFFQMPPLEGRVSLDEQLAEGDARTLATKTFAAWDIDLTGVMEASDLYPREKKCQHAFCLDVDRAGDVRILANVVPGERWIDVMLHESGHAAYDVSIDPDLPYLLRRPAHTFVTEAIALMSGRLVRDPQWLTTFAGLSSESVAGLSDRLRQASAAQMMLFARWGLVMVHFERDLYADPEIDLDARWWELVERFQLVSAPPNPQPGGWASKIHLAVAPVYYHNYLLGDMLASQLLATTKREFGGLVGVREAGAHLLETVFRPGASKRWDAIVEGATGGSLKAADLASALS